MADEKDPPTPKEPAAGAAPAAAGATPPVPTPPMTPATAPGGVQAAAAKPAPGAPAPVPAAATKPAPAESVSRRGFLKWTTVGWVAFSAACTSGLVASTRFLFPNVLFEPPQSFKVGFPSEYTVGEVDTRWKDAYGVWIVRNSEGFYALIAVCTHLGCSPNWLAAENKFKCPCHGSGFYKTGVNFEGPAPGRWSARIVLSDDGQIPGRQVGEVQAEKGEWTKEESFLKV
jgi:cytochrome b6-f complex iron-sulfur subunit